MATLGDRRATAMQRLRAEEVTLAAAKDDIVRQQTRISQTTASLQKLKDTVQARLTDAQQQLAQLQARDRAAVERLVGRGRHGRHLPAARARLLRSRREGVALRVRPAR